MNPTWRNRIALLAGSCVAVACGWWLANESYGLPLLGLGIVLGTCAVALSGQPVDVILLAGLVFGYIVGNRGFAQFQLIPGFPLLPAEGGLALCGAWLLLRSAVAKQLPIRRDALNAIILLWMAIGLVRIGPDFRTHGFLALRDFAMVYYAAFFFIAQAHAGDAGHRRFLVGALLAAVTVTVPLLELFRRFPEFFLNTFAIRGVPLVFFKGDLVATFMAIAVVLGHHRWERTRAPGWLVLVAGALAGVIVSGNRASLLALCVAAGWLVLARRAALARTLMLGAFVAVLVFLGALAIGTVSSRDSFVVSLYERLASITDFSGERTYTSSDVEFKGDNNRFRRVWWETVIDETIDRNPWLGLGFGHDLAAAFVRRYYPESDDEFSARSPHNILITVFGRMGVLGLGAFLLLLAAIAKRTWGALRAPPADDGRELLWLVPWIIATSACFGVVLEGPMAAVVFWTILGIANGTTPGPIAEAEPAAARSESLAVP